ncbi:MAG: MFS transporter [Hyphomonas sp.]
MGQSNFEIGLLFGGAFAIFYGILGLPLARVADVYNRKHLILAGVILWSLSTTFSGFAASYGILVCLRIGIAIGEATLSPSTYSLIGDLFPPEKRALPAAIYATAGSMGGYGSYIVGAAVITGLSSGDIAQSSLLAHFHLWQLVFFTVGVPGLLLSLIVVFTIKEPVRSSSEANTAPSLSEVAKYFIRRYRLYLGLFLGAGGVNLIVFSYGAWAPELFRRTYDWTISQAGFAFGAIGVIASAAGTMTFTMLSEKLRKSGRRDGLIIAAVIASLAGCAAAVAAPIASNATLALASVAIMIFALSGCSNLAVVSVQFIAPGKVRATAIALLFMCTTMLGLGLGPPVVAVFANSVFTGESSLGPALSLLAGLTMPVSACLILWSRHSYILQLDEQT